MISPKQLRELGEGKDLTITIGGVTLRPGQSLMILPDGPGFPDLNKILPVEFIKPTIRKTPCRFPDGRQP